MVVLRIAVDASVVFLLCLWVLVASEAVASLLVCRRYEDEEFRTGLPLLFPSFLLRVPTAGLREVSDAPLLFARMRLLPYFLLAGTESLLTIVPFPSVCTIAAIVFDKSKTDRLDSVEDDDDDDDDGIALIDSCVFRLPRHISISALLDF